MYPFPVVLVGIDVDLLPEVRRELTHAMADVESEFASATAAFECLRRSRKQTRLFIIHADLETDIAEIRRLSDYFTGWPILALMGESESIEDVLRINRAGASQIVTLPLDGEDFQHAVKLIASQFGRGHLDRHVFAVAGAVGGSGATTIAINLASEIADRFRRTTILAELSLQIGALASMLDIHPRVTLAHLLQEFHRVDDLLVEKSLVPLCDGLRVLAGPQEFCALPFAEPGHIARIVGYLKKLADVTVLDVPDVLHDAGAAVLDCADQILLVGLQNVPSIRAMKLFCERHSAERLNHSLWIVINRYNSQLKGFTATEIQELLGVPRLVTIANDFRAVNLAINQGMPLRRVVPETLILQDLDALIHTLLDLERRKAARRGGRLLGRVLDAFKR
jgi:pilus assembly protein CpaE